MLDPKLILKIPNRLGLKIKVLSQEYDVALGPYSPTHQRHSALNFVGHVGVGRNWLLLKYPESRLSDSAVFEPYNLTVNSFFKIFKIKL
jgi:hypothetical protein